MLASILEAPSRESKAMMYDLSSLMSFKWGDFIVVMAATDWVFVAK